MKDNFKFLKLRNQEEQEVQMYIDCNFSKDWGGKEVYTVKNNKPTNTVIADGKYKFTDGRILEISDGKVDTVKSRGEIALEMGMQEFKQEVKELNAKFDAMTEVMVKLLKTKQ